jgi:hypothetical protein
MPFPPRSAKVPDLYFVFLGGPYAAAGLAKIGVIYNTQSGSLQKGDGSGVFNPLDVISNDQGAADLYDFQYTVFNLVVMIAVLVAFVPNPGHGLPQVPDFLAVLTGGSAFVYTANKVTGSNPPSVSSVTPDSARIQDWGTITGANLFDPKADNGATLIKVGGAVVPQGDIDGLSTIAGKRSDVGSGSQPYGRPGWPRFGSTICATRPSPSGYTPEPTSRRCRSGPVTPRWPSPLDCYGHLYGDSDVMLRNKLDAMAEDAESKSIRRIRRLGDGLGDVPPA